MIKSLRIGPSTWKVVVKKLGGVWGYCNAEKREIEISHHAKGRERTAALLHEALHATIAEYGINHSLTIEQEEGVVRVLEAGLLNLFLTNQRFTKDLLKELTK